MNKIFVISVFFVFCFGVNACSDNECQVGERICEDNVSRTCYNGRWRDVTCTKTKPICDETYGCISVKAVCGNGVIDEGEACDGANMGGKTCQDVFKGLVGVLRCDDSCEWDVSGCAIPGCESEEAVCANDVFMRCIDGVWEQTVCASGVCNVREGCVARVCEDGERRCEGDVAEMCVGNAYIVAMDCAKAGGACFEGICEARACEEGARRCVGTRVEICVSNEYKQVMDCSEKGMICDESDGMCILAQ